MVGGVILNGTPESLSGTLGYLSEFSHYLPEKKSGFVDAFATANTCYRRSIFNSHEFMETLPAAQDTVFHWSLIDNGKKLFFDPSSEDYPPK